MRHLDGASGDMLRRGWDPPFGRSLIDGGETTDEVVFAEGRLNETKGS